MSDGCNLAFVKRNNEPSHELNSYVYVCYGIDFASASAIFQLNFAIVPTLWYFFVFHLINLYSKLHRRQITPGGPGGSMSQVVGSNNSYKPIANTAWVRARLCKLQKRVHSTRSRK